MIIFMSRRPKEFQNWTGSATHQLLACWLRIMLKSKDEKHFNDFKFPRHLSNVKYDLVRNDFY